MTKLMDASFASFRYKIAKNIYKLFIFLLLLCLYLFRLFNFLFAQFFGEFYTQVDRFSEPQTDKFIPRGLHVASVLGIHRNHT
jgi:hypothetical protein